ncbi:HAD-superfamily hydrolase, subfamily IIB [Micrococcales bacterium KH10]|nr:HAD-superfamily hydrolase, subfamily IIB [Micrococcales bacterium KH10]
MCAQVNTQAQLKDHASIAESVLPSWTGQPAKPGRYLVGLDIDGTIVTHAGELSPRVARAISDVRQAGHEVVLATGRSLAATLPIAADLGIESGWLVCSNGAVTARLDLDHADGYEIVAAVTFDPEPILRMVQREQPDVLVAVEEIGMASRVSREFPDGELGGDQIVAGLEELCARPATRIVLRSPDHDSAHFVEMASRLGLDEVSYYIGWTAWMDIVAPGVTKASALEQLSRTHLAPYEHSLTIGDGSNDIEMLDWATVSVAMGHADEPVRAAAQVVTLAVENDGLAVVLEWLIDTND